MSDLTPAQVAERLYHQCETIAGSRFVEDDQRLRKIKQALTDALTTFAAKRVAQAKRETWKALETLDGDNHYWSKRPCITCQSVSDAIGRPFGCSKLAALTQEPT